jgi:pilus assembly protein CpaC
MKQRDAIILATIVSLVLLVNSKIIAQNTAPQEPAVQMPANRSELPRLSTGAKGNEDRLRVFVGRSMIVRSPTALKRVSVTDPTIATAIVVAPTQIMIHGLKPATVTLLLWDEQEQIRSFDLQVQLDIRSLISNLKQMFPKENIQATQSGPAIILTGEVSGQAVADQAVALSKTESPSVVNMLQVPAPPKKAGNTIMLQVKFAEVDRSAAQQLGVNLFSTGAGNTLGAISTNQFGRTTEKAGALPSDIQGSGSATGDNSVTGAIGNSLWHTPASVGLSDLLNIFLFRPDVNLGAVIRAIQQKNLLQILAEPNLLAADGQEASFLAGGEFPFPIVQGGTNYSSVTIQFKEFGVRLKFVATVLGNDQIKLKVAPEVSALDFSNGLTISGFLVPALSTRKADTEIELRNGQSFAIAGLLDNRTTESASKVPWLGDIPILGKLFRSRSINKNKTELMVLVTPTIVTPFEPGQAPKGPEFAVPFLENSKLEHK